MKVRFIPTGRSQFFRVLATFTPRIHGRQLISDVKQKRPFAVAGGQSVSKVIKLDQRKEAAESKVLEEFELR